MSDMNSKEARKLFLDAMITAHGNGVSHGLTHLPEDLRYSECLTEYAEVFLAGALAEALPELELPDKELQIFILEVLLEAVTQLSEARRKVPVSLN